MEGKLVKVPICQIKEMDMCGYCLNDNRDILRADNQCREEYVYLCEDCLKKHHYTDIDDD